MKITLALALALATSACGPAELETTDAEEQTVQPEAACAAYLLDKANFTIPLAPFPVTGASGQCITLPAASDNRTSSFRLANCKVRFFDGPKCTGAGLSASGSGVMPAAFDDRTTSLRFF